MQSKIFSTLLIIAIWGLSIPAENAHGSSCDTCVCHSNKNTDVGALINTGFTNGSDSCSKVCEYNFSGTGTGWADNTCYSTGVKVTLPTKITVIDCSQPENVSKCKKLQASL